jgi:hypothetical protein
MWVRPERRYSILWKNLRRIREIADQILAMAPEAPQLKGYSND